ncbi:ABC transporter substrate-binding protein [Niveispirillum sp. KHB5.9]|uniref:ABC transporter substrate-binding protein n=1 Tax=Niveispirillum sp. KHB5.9 TaxID=3400269 RepID=UPI003A8BD0A7
MRKLILALLLLLAPMEAPAQTVTIAVQAEPSSVDPHFSATGVNQELAAHVFDTLIARDATLALVPGLATAWRRVDAVTWEFDLRDGVRFHDGSPFTADDVIYSFRRAPTVPFSPASFAGRVAQVKEIVALSPNRLRMVTRKPYAQLPYDISFITILPKGLGTKVATEDFNAGKAAIGTGPYRFIRWAHGDRIELVRNEDYWGPKPGFANVTFRYISNDAARVAALLSGNVDVIDAVPPADIDWLRRRSDLNLLQSPTVTLLYLHLDSARDDSPFVQAPSGGNPLRKADIRRALSLAIDRQLLIDKVLSGAGVPANQMVPMGSVGFNPDIPPAAHDLTEAKRLLAAAGLSKGFRLTLHATNNRYVGDGLVSQAVAAMLARAGIEVAVEPLPKSVFLPRASKLEFSVLQYGFGSVTGTSLLGMRSVVGSFDPTRGSGGINRGRYSNPEVDRLIDAAEQAPDAAAYEENLRGAAAILAADTGIIPLYHPTTNWAARKHINMQPRRDEWSLAQFMAPTPESP